MNQQHHNEVKKSLVLDQATVDALTLPNGKTDHIEWDRDLKGFGFRLRKDGGRLHRSYVVRYRTKTRQQRRPKIGDYEKITAKQAREAARKELAKVQLGQDPSAEKETERRNGLRTLRVVVNEYLQTKQDDVKDGKYRESSLRVTRLYLTKSKYFGPLHTVAITDIATADIAPLLTAIRRGSGRVTAGRARSSLSALFKWAMQQGYTTHNPIIATKNPDESPDSRERVLTDDELVAIWTACPDDDYGKIIKLLTVLPCRREEIGGLRWPEFDPNADTITLPAARVKNRHKITLPLTPLALSIIESIPERVGRDHLFGSRSGTGFTRWDAGKKELDDRLAGKVLDWRPHDLRRTAATWMAEHGKVQPHVIEAILNHWSGHRGGVAKTYNRATYLPQMKAALSLWDDHLRSLIEGGERKVLSFPQHEIA
jgi:integrase